MSLLLSDYDYDLPLERIAQAPAEPRDHSRLMVLNRARQTIEHRIFRDLPELLASQNPGAMPLPAPLVVANNTRVIRARLIGRRSGTGGVGGGRGGKVEFLLLEEKVPRVWEGLFHASAKYERGLRFEIPTPDGTVLHGTLVRGVKESPVGTVWAEFDRDPLQTGAGEVPLPPYIKKAHPNAEERSYQTIYAQAAQGAERGGSAAAPTAGLHFTPAVLEDLRARGIGWAELTLHVGLGTFRPVKEADITRHAMHEERFHVPESTCSLIARTRASGGKVLAVGTTTVRALESVFSREGELQSGAGRTAIFIYPGYCFRVVDQMLTNFHLPKSTLLMLVSAFAGREFVLEAYRVAVAGGYRFFSYGDAMLIL